MYCASDVLKSIQTHGKHERRLRKQSRGVASVPIPSDHTILEYQSETQSRCVKHVRVIRKHVMRYRIICMFVCLCAHVCLCVHVYVCVGFYNRRTRRQQHQFVCSHTSCLLQASVIRARFQTETSEKCIFRIMLIATSPALSSNELLCVSCSTECSIKLISRLESAPGAA